MSTENSETPRSPSLQADPDSPLFALARQGQLRLPQAWLARYPVAIEKILYPTTVLLYAYLVPTLSTLLGVPLVAAGSGMMQTQPDLGITLLLVGGFLPIFFLIWLWLRLVEQRSLWSSGMTLPVIKPYLRGLVAGLLLFGSAVLLLALLGFLGVENAPNQEVFWPTLAGTFLVLTGWMIQGAAEELLARGFLLPILGVRWGALAGIFVSSLFFSVLHLYNPGINLLSLLNLFLFGLLAALYALNEGQLWGAFALHAIWNWAQGNLFGFEVSGISVQMSMLVDLMETGPDWATGGAFGPEGGAVVTVVLLAGIAFLATIARRRTRELNVPPGKEE